jgi:2-isopropylmalate synthase
LLINTEKKQRTIVSIIDEDKEIKVASRIGSGSIQAIYNAIDELFQQSPELTEYEIQALTGGEDAQAEVRVTLKDEHSNNEFRGIGVDFDVLHASAKAYVQASNHLEQNGK